MGKVKFNRRIKPSNKARAAGIRDVINSKQKQLDAAVQWCHENNKRGWAAVNSGLFPSIKDYRTINKQIDGIITAGNIPPNGLIYAGKGEECQKMIRENRECVTVHPFVSFSGDVAMCHIIFKGKGISQQMAPQEAVTNIPHLLISTNDSGSQDHITLLAA